MKPSPFGWSSASVTHPGKARPVNEDACLALPERGLWAVADGMGGHHAGDLASRSIVESLQQTQRHDNPARLLDEVEERLLEVNRQLFEMAASRTEVCTIGSTVVTLLALRQHAVVAWAGDSRAYRLRDGKLEQITEDHSQVQELVDAGHLQADEADSHPFANVITRAVGGDAELQVDIEVRAIAAGDRYLLCSDGLYRELDEDQLKLLLAEGSCEIACQALLAGVLAGPASDNVSAVVVEFRDAD